MEMVVLEIPQGHQVFKELLDDQLDHFWREPGSDKFMQDRSDWNTLPGTIRRRIKLCVHLLAHMDIEIMDNLDNIPSNSRIISMYLDAQKMMEGIHTLAYDRIDRELEYPLSDKDMDDIQAKVAQLGRYRDTDIQVLAQAMAEGISFMTLFPIFYYLRKKGLLPETCLTNDEVLKDENLHTRAFITMYKVLCNDGVITRIPQDQVHEMVRSFIEVEDMIADTIYGDQSDSDRAFLTVMTPGNSKAYTRIAANAILDATGYDTLYPDYDNPFPFVDQSLVNTLVGFFDRESAEYGIRTDYHYDSDSDLEL